MSPTQASPYAMLYSKRVMPIRLAHELSFSPPPHCPHVEPNGSECGLGILAYGRTEPFATDERGRVYCRVHGAQVEPTYAAAHGAWQEIVKTRRLAAIHALEEAWEDPTLPA